MRVGVDAPTRTGAGSGGNLAVDKGDAGGAAGWRIGADRHLYFLPLSRPHIRRKPTMARSLCRAAELVPQRWCAGAVRRRHSADRRARRHRLPKLIDKATNRDLTKGLKDHLQETKKQIERLEQVFKKLGKEPEGVKCPAIDGLIEEGDEIAGEVADKEVLDAAIVGAAQAVEHYEIARYGTLIAWADSLGHDDIVSFLNTNLNEEKAADKKLSTVALRKGVNRKAAS
jgi:ferritin-like metal-binding protein YciE